MVELVPTKIKCGLDNLRAALQLLIAVRALTVVDGTVRRSRPEEGPGPRERDPVARGVGERMDVRCVLIPWRKLSDSSQKCPRHSVEPDRACAAISVVSRQRGTPCAERLDDQGSTIHNG